MHVMPQVGAFARYPPDFLGHFEAFGANWMEMQRFCNVSFTGKMERDMEHSRSKAEHPTGSSHDELGTYKAMRELLEEEEDVLRALCHILYYEFVYLGYSFPPACEGM